MQPWNFSTHILQHNNVYVKLFEDKQFIYLEFV